MDDTPPGLPSASDIAQAFLELVDRKTRAIEVAGRRVNRKPRRPAGYTYAYLGKMVGTGLSGIEWDIVFTLGNRADHKGIILFSASEVSAELGLDRTNFHRHLRNILNAGPLEKIGRGVLRLNPEMLWHGSSTSQVNILSERYAERIRDRWAEEGEPWLDDSPN